MESADTIILYHSNCSRYQGTGGYYVQGITINGKSAAFQFYTPVCDCCESLVLLRKIGNSILSPVSGIPTKDISQSSPTKLRCNNV